jgi:hypothetical protein
MTVQVDRTRINQATKALAMHRKNVALAKNSQALAAPMVRAAPASTASFRIRRITVQLIALVAVLVPFLP